MKIYLIKQCIFFYLGNIEDKATKLRTLATRKVSEPAQAAAKVDQNGNKNGNISSTLSITCILC